MESGVRNIIVPMVTIFALSGCNTARETYYSHTFDDGSENVAGVSVDAKQRFVWMPIQNVRTLNGQQNAEYTYEFTTRPVVCAEPSPDAVSAFAASISANLSANFKGVDADAGFARSISETVQKMSERIEEFSALKSQPSQTIARIY